MAAPVDFSQEQAVQDELMGLPPPEAPKDKFWRKMREQPAVPIGA